MSKKVDLDYNPFSEPPKAVMEYCNVCNAEHLQYEDGDLMDCIIYHRLHKEPKDVKKAREEKIEIWDIKTKSWIKKIEFYSVK